MPSYSGVWTLPAQMQARGQNLWPIILSGNIGLFSGGSGPLNTIQYITIDTTGNSATFGTLSTPTYIAGGCGSSTTSFTAGGQTLNSSYTSVIQTVLFLTSGTSSTFGQLTAARGHLAGCNSSTRGVFAGGTSGGYTSVIDYITMASAGNATSFGVLSHERQQLAACSSTTRGLFAGGYDNVGSPPLTSLISYITIATTGNATNFGSLTLSPSDLAGCSSNTRGLFAGGTYYNGSAYVATNNIDYVTIATTGNATSFGQLTSARRTLAACSSPTRGVFAGGYGSGSVLNVIDYVTIASTGNAASFGGLVTLMDSSVGTSNCNGGL